MVSATIKSLCRCFCVLYILRLPIIYYGVGPKVQNGSFFYLTPVHPSCKRTSIGQIRQKVIRKRNIYKSLSKNGDLK